MAILRANLNQPRRDSGIPYESASTAFGIIGSLGPTYPGLALLNGIVSKSQQSVAGRHKLVEMRDHPVRSQFRNRNIGISKVHGDHRDPGGAGGHDVRARIPDHDRAFSRAAGSGDGLEQGLRVRLADPERVLPAD